MSERTTPTASVGAPDVAEDIADRGDNALTSGSIAGPPSKLTCPACGGAVWERDEGGMSFYRCHVGHAYTANSMAAEQGELLEQTLWEALRMFEERAELHRRMADRAKVQFPEVAARYADRAAEAHSSTEVIRRILLGESDGPETAGASPRAVME
jgi:two-component system chemotaxis response regulator CheB